MFGSGVSAERPVTNLYGNIKAYSCLQERDYVTKEELYSNLSKEMADYCVARMKPYEDARTGQSITGPCC